MGVPISTRDLKMLFDRELPAIIAALENRTLVEIDTVSVRPVSI